MNRRSMIKTVGIILIIMWASYVPYLFNFPFQERKGVRDLVAEIVQAPDWIKQKIQFEGKTTDDLEKEMIAEVHIHWIVSVSLTAIGILSGCLLIKKIKTGFWLTFFSASLVVIGSRFFIDFLQSELPLAYYSYWYHFSLIRLIHDVLMRLILLGTMIFLTYIYATRKPEDFTNQEYNNTNTP